MGRKKLNIGLFGFGCVGYGLYEVLEKTPALNVQISRICVKDKNKQRQIPDSHFTFDKNEILDNGEINVIVELIDDSQAAYEIVSAALKKGKSVVSANKKLIAEHFEELLELQKTYGGAFLYEGACCASIPIIRNLEEYYDNDLLESIEGIVNGSTNYILTKTGEEKISYQEALKQAQEKGYAESNPILDTGGFDAKFKLLILIAHAFGKILKPEEIFNLGIDNLGELELNYAREKGYKIKLVAQAVKDDSGKITAFVLPKFVDKNDKLYSVDDVFNGIKTKSCFSDVQFFSGKGAGAHPTASAVISDLSALTYDYRYEYKKLSDNCELKAKNEVFLKVLFRHSSAGSAALKKHFCSIEESFQAKEGAYLVGLISLEQVERLKARNNPEYSFVLFGVAENPKAIGFTENHYQREPEIELREPFLY